MSSVDYRARDREEVEAVLDGYAPPTDGPFARWLGIAPPNRYLPEEPEASKDAANPTLFVIPVVQYDESKTESCFDDDDDPVRYGWVDFGGHVDVGGGTGLFSEFVWPGLLQLFRAAPSTRIVYLVDQAFPIPDGPRGDWYRDGLRLPFIGR
jgi:hypothetical protein